MEYKTKLVFHIPCATWNNGLIPVNYNAFKQILLEAFAEIGLTSLYTVSAKGYYKGREYDEILLTVFSSLRGANAAVNAFRKCFKERNNLMKQEALAFERDGVLIVEAL